MKIVFTICLLVYTQLTFAGIAQAQNLEASEYEVKSAFLYNFLKFVDIETTSNLKLCVISEQSEIPDALLSLDGKIIKEMSIQVQQHSYGSSLGACEVAYLMGSNIKRIREALDLLKKSRTLTIGESSEFGLAGGMINFYNEQNKIRFEIFIQAANQAKINISSRLLQLARIRELSKEAIND